MSEIKSELSEEQSAEQEEEYFDEYWLAYRGHIHTLLTWGYADSQNKVLAKHNETDITGFIAEAIQNKLDDPDSPLWCDQIALKDDPPIPGGGRTGRKRWRPDLIFESVEKRPRPNIISKLNVYVENKAYMNILEKTDYYVLLTVDMLMRAVRPECLGMCSLIT